MRFNIKPILILLAASILSNIVLAIFFIFEYRSDISAHHDQGRYLSEYDPYIVDARRRWASKNRFSENPFRNRTTSVITLDDRICVSFEYSQPDIGGAPPFYCYGFEGVNLISKRDDVE